MQKPFAYSSVDKIAQHFILTGRQISIITVAAAILLCMISFEFVHMQYGGSHSGARPSPASSGELATGMPVPQRAGCSPDRQTGRLRCVAVAFRNDV
jgi:hypothetical protein